MCPQNSPHVVREPRGHMPFSRRLARILHTFDFTVVQLAAR